MLSLPSPKCINLAIVFPAFSRLLVRGGGALQVHCMAVMGGIIILPGLAVVCLPLTLQALFHAMNACTLLVLPVFRILSESCMDAFCIPSLSCISL